MYDQSLYALRTPGNWIDDAQITYALSRISEEATDCGFQVAVWKPAEVENMIKGHHPDEKNCLSRRERACELMEWPGHCRMNRETFKKLVFKIRVVIPINDRFVARPGKEVYTETHWSLLLVDMYTNAGSYLWESSSWAVDHIKSRPNKHAAKRVARTVCQMGTERFGGGHPRKGHTVDDEIRIQHLQCPQ